MALYEWLRHHSAGLQVVPPCLDPTTGGLAPHDQTPQLNCSQPRASIPKKPRPCECCSLSSVSGIGTDTITTHGHPAFDAQESRGGHSSCDPAPLTTSLGTVGQWWRQLLAMTPTTRHNATRLCHYDTDMASLPVLQHSRQSSAEVSCWNSTSLGGTSPLSSRWTGWNSRQSSEVDWTMQRDGLPTRWKFSVVVANFTRTAFQTLCIIVFRAV